MLSLLLIGCTNSNTSLAEADKRIKEAERQIEKQEEAVVSRSLSPLSRRQNTVGKTIISYGSLIEVIEAKANAKISYKSFKTLVSELIKEGKLRMWSEDKIASEIFNLPKGGLITIEISGYSIDSVNSKYWEYLLLSMEDKVLARMNGAGKTPEFTMITASVAKWWNIDSVELDRDLGPFKVYVINLLSNSRSGFKIFPNKP